MKFWIICAFVCLAIAHLTQSRSSNGKHSRLRGLLEKTEAKNRARLSHQERAQILAFLEKSKSNDESTADDQRAELRELSDKTVALDGPELENKERAKVRELSDKTVAVDGPELENKERAELRELSDKTVALDGPSEKSIQHSRSMVNSDNNGDDAYILHDFERRGPSNTQVKKVLDLTNQARRTGRYCGGKWYAAASSVKWNDQLAQAAQKHAQSMLTYNYFSHDGYDGSSFVQRIAATGYSSNCAASENIAGNQTPEATVNSWISSPGHCSNLMASGSKSLGVGYAKGGPYGGYWVQNFGRC